MGGQLNVLKCYKILRDVLIEESVHVKYLAEKK